MCLCLCLRRCMCLCLCLSLLCSSLWSFSRFCNALGGSSESLGRGGQASLRSALQECVYNYMPTLLLSFASFSRFFVTFFVHFLTDLIDFGGSGARPAKYIEKYRFQEASWRPSRRQDRPSWSQDGAKLLNVAPRCAQDGQLGS